MIFSEIMARIEADVAPDLIQQYTDLLNSPFKMT